MKRCFCFVFALSFGTALMAQDTVSEPLPVNEPAVQTGVPGLRKFPANALRGKLRVVQAPEVLLDGKRERLAPGSRIRDPLQRLVLSASVTNVDLIVNFTRNATGEIQEVWILSDAEAAQKIKTNTPANNFHFASQGDAVKPDDGKTPFHQLPSFEQLGRQQRDQQPKR